MRRLTLILAASAAFLVGCSSSGSDAAPTTTDPSTVSTRSEGGTSTTTTPPATEGWVVEIAPEVIEYLDTMGDFADEALVDCEDEASFGCQLDLKVGVINTSINVDLLLGVIDQHSDGTLPVALQPTVDLAEKLSVARENATTCDIEDPDCQEWRSVLLFGMQDLADTAPAWREVME